MSSTEKPGFEQYWIVICQNSPGLLDDQIQFQDKPKIKQQDLLRDGKNISDSIAYFTRVYDLLNIPKHISVSACRLIASTCKVKCFWIWKQRKLRKW